MTIEGLSPDIAESEHLSDFNSVDDLAKSFVELKANPPAAEFALPESVKDNELFKDVKGPEDLANLAVDLHGQVPQVPGSPDSYKFDDLPEDLPFDEADHAAFRKAAHDLGITQQQFEGLMKFDIGRMGAFAKQLEGKVAENMEALRKETGKTAEQIETEAKEVAKALGMEELAGRLDLKADPTFVKAMLKIRSVISEDHLKMGVLSSQNQEYQKADDGMPVLSYPSMQR